MRRIVIYFSVFCILIVSRAESSDQNTTKALSSYIRAGIYERLNQLDVATEFYKTALKSDFVSSRIHLRLARVLLKQSKLKEASSELELAIKYQSPLVEQAEADPSIIEAHTLLALIYSLQGEMDKATAEYENALCGVLTIQPENIEIHKSLAQVYYRKKEFPKAEKTYEFILSTSPSDHEAHFMLGSVFEEQGKRSQAINEFKDAIKYNPEYHLALNSLGYLYAEESIRLKEAEEMIKKALVFEPNNGAYIDSLGWVYYKQAKYEQAVQELERAIQFFPDPIIYEHLADAYLKQDNLIKARENWQKSLEIDSKENLRVKEKLEQHNP